MAKLVDAPDLGSGAARRGGSSPSTRAIFNWPIAYGYLRAVGFELSPLTCTTFYWPIAYSYLRLLGFEVSPLTCTTLKVYSIDSKTGDRLSDKWNIQKITHVRQTA